MKTAVLKFWRSFTYCLFLIPTYKLIHLKLMWNNIIWSSVKYRRESLFRMYGISAFLLTFVIFWNNSCLILWFVLPTLSKALFFFLSSLHLATNFFWYVFAAFRTFFWFRSLYIIFLIHSHLFLPSCVLHHWCCMQSVYCSDYQTQVKIGFRVVIRITVSVTQNARCYQYSRKKH